MCGVRGSEFLEKAASLLVYRMKKKKNLLKEVCTV